MDKKIFGIGLSRTGTKSLTNALRILGYTATHFPFTLEEIDAYEAATDTTVACRFHQLDLRYPGSKFILTERDIESWLRSCERHMSLRPTLSEMSDLERNAVVFSRQSIYHTLEFDKVKFRENFLRHRNDVLKYFESRPSDLLVIDICAGEGWEKLCPFLGREAPLVPFPHANRSRRSTLFGRSIIKKILRLATRLLQ